MNRTGFTPSELADVETHPEGGDRWTLVFRRRLPHPIDRVWAALTEPAQLAQWAPYTADRDLSQPGDATLTMIDRDVREPLAATVLEVDRPRLLAYRWGDDLLRWELSPAGDGTLLTLRHTFAGRENGPRAAAGWHLCLDVAAGLLDGAPVGPIRGRDALEFGWQELHDAYEERVGG
jgi:uncharacterized protein YndB with AHSA1/START domain